MDRIDVKYILSSDMFQEIIKYINPENLRGVCCMIDSIVETYYKGISSNVAVLRSLRMMNIMSRKLPFINLPLNFMGHAKHLRFGNDDIAEKIVNTYIDNLCGDAIDKELMIVLLAIYNTKYNHKLHTVTWYELESCYKLLYNVIGYGWLVIKRFNCPILDDNDSKSYSELGFFVIDVYNMYNAMLGRNDRFKLITQTIVTMCSACDEDVLRDCNCEIEGVDNTYIAYIMHLRKWYQPDEQRGFVDKMVNVEKNTPNWFYI